MTIYKLTDFCTQEEFYFTTRDKARKKVQEQLTDGSPEVLHDLAKQNGYKDINAFLDAVVSSDQFDEELEVLIEEIEAL